MKIGGVPLADDIKRIEAALKVVGGKGENLCVDVNGRYDLDEALACGDAIAPYNLRWYEEPLDPLDYLLHAALATRYAPPLATGENLFSMQDARNLIRHGGLRADRDWLQFDPALSYGLVEYLRTLDMLAAHGWSRRRCVPHGGHQFALNIAVGLGLGGNESYPQVFAPFGGFADNCAVVDSRVTMPDIPGIGFEAKNALYAVMKPLLAAGDSSAINHTQCPGAIGNFDGSRTVRQWGPDPGGGGYAYKARVFRGGDRAQSWRLRERS